MGIITGCVVLAALVTLPAIRFARLAWRFSAARTVITVVAAQVVLLGAMILWGLLAPRPDLAGFGWFALAWVAIALPLAVGDLGRRSPVRPLAVVSASLAVVVAAATCVLALAPTLTSTTIAGKSIPVTADTLANGYQLAVQIPATTSGFKAREAHLWVPPGWLMRPDQKRPVSEMMMGQPGNPTLGASLDALHALGAQTLETAPFVLVVDQLGAVDRNPPCANTAAGGQLETYLAEDVPHWIRANLPVLPDARSWTIAGFSHGGECAAFLAAAHPSLWANMISVSGPDKPGEHLPVSTKNTYFNGSEADFESTWPANVMAKGTYPDTTAIFVTGALDAHFRPQVEATATAAEKARWHVTYWVVPGQSHSGPTLSKGLETGYDKLISIAQSGRNAVDPSRALCDSSATVRDCASAQVAATTATVVLTDLGLLLIFLVVQFALFFRLRQTAPTTT